MHIVIKLVRTNTPLTGVPCLEIKKSVQMGIQQFQFNCQNSAHASSYPPCAVGPICAKGSNISNGLAKNEPVLNPINGIFGNPEIQKTTDFYQLTKYMFEFPELCVWVLQ